MKNENNLCLCSEIRSDGTLNLFIQPQALKPLGSGEILVEVQAAPINPADIALMLANADMTTARKTGKGLEAIFSADIPGKRVGGFAGRLDQPLPTGIEAAGTVIDAAPDCADLVERATERCRRLRRRGVLGRHQAQGRQGGVPAQ